MYFHPSLSLCTYRRVRAEVRREMFFDAQLPLPLTVPATPPEKWAVVGNTAHKCQK